MLKGLAALLLVANITFAQMISGDLVNDPAKAKVCGVQLEKQNNIVVPFVIDRAFVFEQRIYNPDAIFVVVNDKIGGRGLWECLPGKDGDIVPAIGHVNSSDGPWYAIDPKTHQIEVSTRGGLNPVWIEKPIP